MNKIFYYLAFFSLGCSFMHLLFGQYIQASVTVSAAGLSYLLGLLFKEDIEPQEIPQIEISAEVWTEKDEWIDFSKEKPGHEVVLAACNTYDCGWVIDTAWWNPEEECWMTTGSVSSEYAHLPYTHWKKLPEEPKTKSEE